MNKITKDSFILRPSVGDNMTPTFVVELKDAPYSGVVIEYGRVSIKEADDQQSASLQFDYEIYDLDDESRKEQLESSKEFCDYIGHVLTYIIVDALDTGNYKVGATQTQTIDVDATTIHDPATDRK